MRIYKWSLQDTALQTLILPLGAQILTVQMQNDHPQLWALCEDQAVLTQPGQIRTIAIYETGSSLPDNPGAYIGTFQMQQGAVVCHVFAVGEEKP